MKRLRPFLGIILLISMTSTLVLASLEEPDHKLYIVSNPVPQKPTMTTRDSRTPTDRSQEKVQTDKPTKPEPPATPAEKAPTDKPVKPEPPKTPAEKGPTNKPEPPKTQAEKVPTDRPEPPITPAEKVPTDKPEPPKTPAEKVPTDKPEPPKTPAEKVPTDKPEPPETPAEKVPTDKPELPKTSAEKAPTDKPTSPETPEEEKPVPGSKPQPPTLQQSYYDYIHGLLPSLWRTDNGPESVKLVDALLYIPNNNRHIRNIPNVLFNEGEILPLNRLSERRGMSYKEQVPKSFRGLGPQGEFKAVKSPDGRWLWHWFGLGNKDEEKKPTQQSGPIDEHFPLKPGTEHHNGGEIVVNDKGEIEWDDVIILKPRNDAEPGESMYDCPWKPKRKRTTPPQNNIQGSSKSSSFFRGYQPF